jgi:hypothetical protein
MSFRRVLAALLFLALLPTYAFAAFPADALPSDRGAARGGAGKPGDLMLWWDMPIRWYTGVAMSIRPTYYEFDNRQLTWSISNAPAGMSIDGTGTISWASPTAGTYAGIVVTVTRASCDSTAFTGCSLTASQTFTLTVGTSDFVFVAPAGTDNVGCGAIGSPCATLSYAITNKISGSDGKTIYLRSGTITDSFSMASVGSFDTNAFTQADYMEIANYPGETVTINSAAASGIATSNNAVWVVVRGFKVSGSTTGPNLIARGTHVIFKDMQSTGATYDANNNLHGVELSGGDDSVLNRIVSWSNKGAVGNQNNVANFEFYNDVASSDHFALNLKAYDSNWNYKLKHTNADNSRLILHNFEGHTSAADQGGFVGYGKNSSVRYGVLYNDAGFGMDLGLTDPSSYVVQQMLVEHMDVISSSTTSSSIRIDESYGTTGPLTLYRNIVYQGNGACVAGNPDPANRKILQTLWYYTAAATSRAYAHVSDYNIWHNTSGDTDCFHIGNTGAADPKTFAQYQALTGAGITRDPNSITTTPGFNSVGTGDLTIDSGDAAATSCGSGQYCGAFRPGQSYGTVGVSNTTLLNFDHSGNSSGAAPSTTTASPIAALIHYFCRQHRDL